MGIVTVGMILLWLLFSFFVSIPSLAGFYSVKAYDSIAGYGTEIKIGNATKGEKVKIFILPPTQELQTYLYDIPESGDGSFIIAPEKTQHFGIYKVVVVEPSQSYSDGVVSSFEIFPDDPSVQKSSFYAVDNTVPTGTKGKITLILQDQYDNPVAQHRITLRSNRTSDKFTALGEPKTNDAGEVSFFVQSNASGDALITAFDETFGESVGKSITLRFYKNAITSSLMGDISTSISNDRVARFSLDFADTLPVNSDANYLTVTALDASGKTVTDFVGSVLISVPTDPNATVPGEKGVYTFTEKDQGKVTFSRSFLFPTAGKQRLEVYAYNNTTDVVNYNVFGKKEVTIETKNTGTDPGAQEQSITIETPSNNTIIASNSVIVTGSGLKNADFYVLLDGKIIKSIASDEKGDFSTTLFSLSSGTHTLQIQQKNNTKIISSTISFRVGEGMGQITSASFSPEQVSPKETVEVLVTVDPSVPPTLLEVTLNSVSHTLKKIKEGTYQASVPAPAKEGTYPVVISIQNSLGEIKEHTLPASLQVGGPSATVAPSSGVVTGLTAEFISSRNVVQLSWKKLTPDPLLYIIHSGSSANALQKVKSVSGTTAMAEIDMSSFSEKYFAISAVDISGSEGAKSVAVKMIQAATPTPSPSPSPLIGTPTPTPTPLITPVVTPTPLPMISTLIPQENAIRVTWTPYAGAKQYKILYGISSRVYQGEIKIDGNSIEKTITDAIPGVTYYIQVEAIGETGNTLYSYGEKSTEPLSSAFHASASSAPQPYPQWITQTGPQFFLFVGGLFLMTSAWFFSRREKMFSK